MVQSRPLLIITAVMAFTAAAANSQTLTPFLLHDLNPSTEGRVQTIRDFLPPLAPTDDVFFVSQEPTPGVWHAGTGSQGDYFVSDDTEVTTNGPLTFLWDDAYPITLKATDGTTPGIRTLGKFPGICGMAPLGTKTFFSACNNLVGLTDGTAAGTSIITSTEPRFTDTNMPLYLASTGDRVFFKSYDLDHGQCYSIDQGSWCGELWTSDGTKAGTHLVADIIPGPFPGAPESIFAWNGKAFFAAFAADLDLKFRYIYVSDGTAAGTRPLTKAAAISRGSFAPFIGAGKYVYFAGSQLQWWRTEGTPESTVMVRDLAGLQDPAFVASLIASPTTILFLVSRAASTTTAELWSYDGTQSAKLRDLASANFNLLGYVPAINRFYYATIEPGDHEQTLYATDGTSAGHAIRKLPMITAILRFVPGEHLSHFLAYDGRTFQLWQTDGTAAGTHPSHNESQIGGIGSDPASLTTVSNRLYFFANAGDGVKSLFVTDGSAAPLRVSPPVTCGFSCPPLEVRDGALYVNQGQNSVKVENSTASLISQTFGVDYPMTLPIHFGDADYLIAAGSAGAELHRRDAAGNHLIASAASLASTVKMLETPTHLFFGDNNSLWSSDGTTAGTQRLITGDVDQLGATADGVYFAHSDSGNRQVWFSDGTAGGTRPITAASELSVPLNAIPLATWHNMFFFIDARSERIWRTQSAGQGTIELPIPSADFIAAVDLGDRLALIWYDRIKDICAIWMTDGTPAATTLRHTADHLLSRVLEPFRLANGDVYVSFFREGGFTLMNVATGEMKPYTTTTTLTMFPSGAQVMAGLGSRAVFAAESLRTGRELWAFDLAGGKGSAVPTASIAYDGVTVVNGKRVAVFRATINGESVAASSLHYETADGTLHAGRDYTATFGSLSVPAGQTTRSIVVPIGDAAGTFNLIISQPENAQITTGFAAAALPSLTERRRASRP